MYIRDLFEKKLETLEDIPLEAEEFGDAVTKLKTLSDIVKAEEDRSIKVEELELKRRQVENENDKKNLESKNKQFETIMKTIGIALSGALTIAQIMIVGSLEKESILSSHPFAFINKKNINA